VAAAFGIVTADARAQAHQPPKVEKDDYVWERESNPFAGDPDAIVQGRRLYRSTCYICHLDAGGRGPDLRKSKLKEQDFMRVVINGRKGTQMPAWKGKLTEAEMWKIYTFLQAPRE
jgi:mono/diheme cytochrome c family protein